VSKATVLAQPASGGPAVPLKTYTAAQVTGDILNLDALKPDLKPGQYSVRLQVQLSGGRTFDSPARPLTVLEAPSSWGISTQRASGTRRSRSRPR